MNNTTLEVHMRIVVDSEGKRFTEAYQDGEMTRKYASWPHWRSVTPRGSRPRKGCKYVTLNCYRYRAVWH